MDFDKLTGENVREIPEEEILEQMKLRIKYLSPVGLRRAKKAIDQARKFPDSYGYRRIGYTTLPKHLMDNAYELIVEQLEK